MVSYRNGDYAAFEALYRRHAGKVYAFLKSRTSRGEEASDLHQQVFFQLHKNRHRYDAGLPFLPWLYAIVRNLLIDFYRKKKAIAVPDEVLEKIPSPVSDGSEKAMALEAALETLEPAQRELILMRFGEGLSFEEISERTGTTALTSRKRVSRILARLRSVFSGTKEESR